MRIPSCLILLLSTSAAFAAQPPAAAMPDANGWKTLACMMDSDGNGKLTGEEVKSFDPEPARLLVKSFAKIDANQDGVVTFKEYSAYLDKDRVDWEALFKQADTDKSGGLSHEELKAAKARAFNLDSRRFSMIDTDRNGEVTLQEHEQFLKLTGERRGGRHTSRDSGGRKAGPADVQN